MTHAMTTSHARIEVDGDRVVIRARDGGLVGAVLLRLSASEALAVAAAIGAVARGARKAEGGT